LVLVVAQVLRMHPVASPEWTEFSIGPAAGESAAIQSGTMRADGVSLKAALATAYDIPAVRVIAPPWLAETRYSINAAVDVERSGAFRSLLRQELNNRLRLETHLEVRPFEIFVLTATDAPRLEHSRGNTPGIWIDKRTARFQDASMELVASGLQAILGKPVIDETGITGAHNLELAWGDDRTAAVTAALRDRFGLRLSPATRDMEALIVDSVRRDPSLLLLAEIGRLTRAAPSNLRHRIAQALTIQ
jgi:uncharacterized protein (TIGR03435 family)